MSERVGFIRRIWRFLWAPSARWSFAVLVGGGILVGVVGLGAFNTFLHYSNTEEFCVGCHEMRENPFAEMEGTIHVSNRTGFHAICSDCHVPKDYFTKLGIKIYKTRELFLHAIGRLDTPEKYEANRLRLATTVWGHMKETDSRECRGCHKSTWEEAAMKHQFGGAVRNHTAAIEAGDLTCIDCHQGIAHTLPKEFERPKLEQLTDDPEGWLEQLKQQVVASAG